MALKEDYIKYGHFLFKFRGIIPLLLLPFAVIVLYFGLDRCNSFSIELYYCAIVSFLGIIVRGVAVGYSSKNTSGRNTQTQKADSINKSGIYSLVRHPLYLGNYLIWLGLCLYSGSPIIIIGSFIIFWRYYEIIMFTEEEFLRVKFGKDYEDWANKIPAVIPNWRHYQKNSNPFSIKKVLRKENDGAYALVICFFLLRLVMDFSSGKSIDFTISDSWLITFIVATIMYVLIKFLKKKTRLLKD